MNKGESAMKVLKWIDEHFEEALIATIICVIACLMMTQIILRNVFRSSLSFSDEACRYLYVWAAGLGIPYATKMGYHLRMDILPNLVKLLEKPLLVLCDIVLLWLAFYLLLPGYRVLSQLAKTGQMTATTNIPMYYVYASLWIGLILTVIRIIEKYLKLFFSKRNNGEVK
jgi:TRAP-type C4-dicarboxylate transport system permease small subunit